MTAIDKLSTGPKAYIILFLLTLLASAPGVFNLPALDRDESRFAQASKEMLEEENYILIQYQDELRNKKPAGIHWLQAASTALTTGPEAKEIWTYRVPSWLGAALAAMACLWAGIPLVGRRAAFIGAALFGSTLLLTSEAHISKTDGVLVFLTTLGIGMLARLYMHGDNDKRMAIAFWGIMGLSFLIKGPVTPMVAAYAGFGAWVWTRAATGKNGDWWRSLAWWPGPLLFVLIVLPWLIWIQVATDWEFLRGAVGKDLKDKFTGASEGHGGWPLYHLTHIPAWFFPATLLFVPGLMAAWSRLKPKTPELRSQFYGLLFAAGGLFVVLFVLNYGAGYLPEGFTFKPLPAFAAVLVGVVWWASSGKNWHVSGDDAVDARGLRMVIAWAGLTYIFFELMPTLLSHYILPAYPAMGLLCGYAVVRLMEGERQPVSHWLSIILFAIGGGALLFASTPVAADLFMVEAAGDFSTVRDVDVLADWADFKSFPMWLWWVSFAFIGLTLIEFARKHVGTSVIFSVLAATAIGWHIRTFFLPNQIWVQPTETARLALEDICGVPGKDCKQTGQRGGFSTPERILAWGYAEPSFIMTLGTQNLHPPHTPLDLPKTAGDYPVVYIINYEDRKADPAGYDVFNSLKQQADDLGACTSVGESYYALNYSNGDPVHFQAVRFDWGECPR